ncbi:hypothetical protein [Shewanella sp. SR44-3]|uniref:hypothetical protein n=1 Tax=Shewanella sp. SR44-3 TaxID=2760936 RepID=UPI0015FA4DDC|nr:hypothetical protein [Shewanella sp. SR44-3]MBB1268846.1 hypothetical protein [Shewanella sp. SR44-3]
MLSIYQCVAAKLTSQNRTQAVITMPIWQYLYASLLLLLLCPETIASDESWQQLVEQVELQDPQTHEAPKLKLGKPLVLDNQGNSMEHKAADEIEVGLEFRAQDTPDLSERLSEGSKLSEGRSHKKSTQTRSKNKTKTLSRKQQLASRKRVANDVGCRWLNSRMDHLEGQLTQAGTQDLGHQAAELKIRQKEWQCLKCGVEGPSIADRSRCQHKR